LSSDSLILLPRFLVAYDFTLIKIIQKRKLTKGSGGNEAFYEGKQNESEKQLLLLGYH